MTTGISARRPELSMRKDPRPDKDFPEAGSRSGPPGPGKTGHLSVTDTRVPVSRSAPRAPQRKPIRSSRPPEGPSPFSLSLAEVPASCGPATPSIQPSCPRHSTLFYSPPGQHGRGPRAKDRRRSRHSQHPLFDSQNSLGRSKKLCPKGPTPIRK